MRQTFRDKSFEITVLDGTMHPGFAVFTFDTEEKEFREKYWNVREGDVVFDVGAAYGSYTLAALAMGAAKVYAFEPEPKIYPNLYENVAINGWSDRCDVLPCGLWNEDADVDIKSYAPHYATQLTAPTYTMKRLDAFARVRKVDWLKVDVEGAEENVIAGGMQFISTYKPNLIIECDDFIDANIINRISERLEEKYYFKRVPRGECTFLVGTPK